MKKLVLKIGKVSILINATTLRGSQEFPLTELFQVFKMYLETKFNVQWKNPLHFSLKGCADVD